MTPRILFTADLHFGHAGVIKHCRPWAESPDDMNAGIVSEWNEVVNPCDTVYILGDLSFLGLARTVECVGQLKGHKKLVPGNHDEPKLCRKLHEMGLVELLPELTYVKTHGERLVLCHYPLTSWRSMQLGSFHFHGHCHGNLPAQGRRMDVGVDAGHGMAPNELEYLIWLRKNVPYVQVDHHAYQG